MIIDKRKSIINYQLSIIKIMKDNALSNILSSYETKEQIDGQFIP
jgi:hypothetical protein